MDQQAPEEIEITTKLPLAEFKSLAWVMEDQFSQAGIVVGLGGDTVARTYARRHYADWFVSQNNEYADFLMYATYNGSADWIITDKWEDINTDVKLVWTFYPDIEGHRDLAILFKLAFGGNS